ncbi:MAG: zinc-ribbon and DUF3426 domain-containing protein [Porticoccus sp.]|nr:zinc-ribbon and DUF3426 domain-containing protein [Porticoccus sp.]
MTEIITRCPGCSASFRASPAHLEAANGQIRCGSCLLLFDACAHQIKEEQPRDNPSENDLSLDSDDLLIHDDMDISVLDGYEQEQDNPSHLPPNNSSDEPHESTAQRETAQAGAPPEIEPEPTEHPELTDNINTVESTEELVATDISLPLQQDLLTTTEEDPAEGSAPPPSVDVESETDLFGSDEITTTPDFLLAPESPPRNYLKMLLWPTLSVLAMMVLIFQYIHFNADILGTDPSHRPWLIPFCDITTCKLPTMRDTTQIRSSKLLVHSHPDISGALIVDAVIINEANFDQPFPELALNFEDLQGASVARRNFKPGEYLRGEMTGATIMPTDQPVRLTLELLDPGPKAVNYSLFIPE